MRKASSKRLTGCWNAAGGSSAGEPGISAAEQAESGSKLRFGGVSNVGVYREQRVSGLYRMSEM